MNSSRGGGPAYSEPPVLECEPERLSELFSLDILDTAFEERFDRYTDLVASLFEFPISLVTLVDDHRQWFKSAHGLDIRETKRDRSFCAHALAQGGVFIVPDTHADPRFAKNPLVTGYPYIRFYAGAIVRGPEGMPLGTLCVLDRKPRSFNDRDCKHLSQFAELVEHEIQHNHKIRQIRREAQEAAYVDELTGLSSRRLFHDRLERHVRLARSQEHFSFTVLHIDVVGFMRLNRALGHEAGDVVLCEIARRLRRLCPPDGTVARLQADRFAVLLPREVHENQVPEPVIGQIARELSRPLYIDNREQYLRLRIGACRCPSPAETGEALLERAAEAARLGGTPLARGVHVHFHDDRTETQLERQFEVETRLRAALEHEQFQLVYQPVFDVATGRSVSLEALIRWHERELGNIPPDEFIPLAEATGLIVPVGEWVMAEALHQYRQWREQGLAPLPIHVNVSARELDEPDFVPRVTALLDRMGVPGKALLLEITETVLISEIEANAEKMAQLSQRGVKFYIDDFGKGYSSLHYLRRLPFAALKIDRGFVTHVTEDPSDATMAHAVVALGRTLGVSVVAEGVETKEQLEFLRDTGCAQVQGYLLGRPVPGDDVIAALQ